MRACLYYCIHRWLCECSLFNTVFGVGGEFVAMNGNCVGAERIYRYEWKLCGVNSPIAMNGNSV